MRSCYLNETISKDKLTDNWWNLSTLCNNGNCLKNKIKN